MAAEHEKLAQSGILIGQPESPALEAAAGEAIEGAFRELIEKRYLYQKVGLDYRGVDEAIRQSIKREEAIRATTLNVSHPAPDTPLQKATAQRLNDLHNEIETRP